MTAQDMLGLVRRRPFVPFRLYASDGRTYDIHHPGQALVLLTRAVLAVSSNGGIPERDEHLAVSHIVRAEELPSEASRSTE